MPHPTFITTTRGLDRTAPAMMLYEKAKRLGIWNPSDLDLAQDILDWQWLKKDEQDLILRLTALFQAGEEAVTRDLLPLIQVIASEGRLEEEMFLTTFLFEEAKHTDFFRRFLDQVARVRGELTHYHTKNYRAIFYAALPRALGRLREDASPRAQAEAAVTYNLIVEGVLAETGYHAYLTALERNGLMPGTCKAIKLLKQDESRHLAYGIYLLSRLVAADGKLWKVIEARMNKLLTPALGIIGDAFAAYDPIPFGLNYDEFVEFATTQFRHRIERVERARGASLDAITKVTQDVIEQGET
ncbi:MAG: R2-like ligand-binding oxidase [Chloroflexi bacterium]|nr:R2-like ligand-binding oxidase [Chloroflexota bacterium]